MATPRTEWIAARVETLMAETTTTVELVEDIQLHGGVAHRGFCAALLRFLAAETQAAAERATDDACAILHAFAYERARREYDAGVPA